MSSTAPHDSDSESSENASKGKERAKTVRPHLTEETMSDLPVSLRQKILDGFIEEYLKMGNSEEEAKQRALSEEKLLNEENGSKMLYLTSASNHLKKLRVRSAKMNQDLPASKKTKPSESTIVQSDKSSTGTVVKQGRVAEEGLVFPLDEILSGTSSKPKPGTSSSVVHSRKRTHSHNTEDLVECQMLNFAPSGNVLPPSSLNPAGIVYKSPGNSAQYYFSLTTGDGEPSIQPLSSLEHVTFLKRQKSCDQSCDLTTTTTDKTKSVDLPATGDKIDKGVHGLHGESVSTRASQQQVSATSSSIHNTHQTSSVPDGPGARNNFSIVTKKKNSEFTKNVFYELLNDSYTMSEEELVENGYPRPTEENGVARINWRETAHPIIPVGNKAARHICCRCQKPFLIYENGRYQDVEECVHHYGRIRRHRHLGFGFVAMYSCCYGYQSSAGCQVAKMHVTAGEKKPLHDGYVKTGSTGEGNEHCEVYALDCEMCYTTAGLELTRVTVVNMECETVYETLVKPPHPITDYNTRFSGLFPEDLAGVEVTLVDVQKHILSFVSESTILMGHSLESDLRSLKIIHSKVVDTSIVFPHRMGPPYKRALKTLMAEHLSKIIQENASGGHDSAEDARSCMELMLMKTKSDFQKKLRTGN